MIPTVFIPIQPIRVPECILESGWEAGVAGAEQGLVSDLAFDHIGPENINLFSIARRLPMQP